jgi:2-succinyl-5-enolpyruvyl-6-hydroxy-3-cyclohexene-1-carboxylate synthase
MDVIYYSASNREELALTLEKFLSESDKPILLEVFTNADTDSKVLKSFYSINSIAPKKRINTHIKKYIKSLLARFGISIARYK